MTRRRIAMSKNPWTIEKLKAKTPSERLTLYKNAVKLGDAGKELISLLDEAGLPYSDDESLKGSDPLTLKIADIAFSPEGTAAMRDAIDKGMPPMAGLDPLLSEAVGNDYGPHNSSTNWAGRIAAERMERLGFRKTGKKATLPSGCIARTAEVMK
jgi:hypothetical protein